MSQAGVCWKRDDDVVHGLDLRKSDLAIVILGDKLVFGDVLVISDVADRELITSDFRPGESALLGSPISIIGWA